MTSAPIDRVLTAFEAAGYPPRREGKGWRAPCPVCRTRTRKVSLNVAPNGSVLLHPFCGHASGEALAALGLTVADLFEHCDLRSLAPDERASLQEHVRQTQWRAALATLRLEVLVVLAAACAYGDLPDMSDADKHRLRLAALRIFDAGEVLHV